MESSEEPNHLEGEGFCPIIELIRKGNREIDLHKWHGLLPRHDAVERCWGWAEMCPVDTHFVEHLGVHDVEATASIHQYFGESLWADDRVDHKRISPRLFDAFRVVGPIKDCGGLR